MRLMRTIGPVLHLRVVRRSAACAWRCSPDCCRLRRRSPRCRAERAAPQPPQVPPRIAAPAQCRSTRSSSATRSSKRSAPSSSAARSRTEAKLKREIESIGDDRRKLNQQLIDTAARVRGVEDRDRPDRRRASSRSTTASRRCANRSRSRRGVIAEVLAALQRIGRQPPPAIMVRPEDALQSCVRSAMHARRGAAGDAAAGRGAGGRSRRARAHAQGDRRRARPPARAISPLIARRPPAADAADRRAAETAGGCREGARRAERQRAADLARQADNLKDLIGKLEAGPRQRQPRRPARRPRADDEEGAGHPDRPAPPSRTPAGWPRRSPLRPPAARCRCRSMASESGNLGPRTASAAPKRASRSPPGPAPRSPPRATAGWFMPAPSAITANS